MPLRRRTFRDGTVLLANQAANLVNVTAARNVACERRALALALKTPGINDKSA
ncbi:hypothetical protein FRC12_006496 [Ceratobasidium sp. 428]|nr:hypothetical protein FRC12_006496 [Ceratobasidium sp. 428]